MQRCEGRGMHWGHEELGGHCDRDRSTLSMGGVDRDNAGDVARPRRHRPLADVLWTWGSILSLLGHCYKVLFNRCYKRD